MATVTAHAGSADALNKAINAATGNNEQPRGGLEVAGYGPQLEQLQLILNRPAEQATAEAGDIVRTTVEAMTVRDTVDILQGLKTRPHSTYVTIVRISYLPLSNLLLPRPPTRPR